MWDKTIVRLSAGQSPAAFAAQMQAAIIKMGAGGERAGYAPIKLVGQTLYSRCGGGDGARPAEQLHWDLTREHAHAQGID